MVSVYVASGGNLIDTISQLKAEQGTAINIKSKATRKNVLTALDKIINHLRLFRATPKNGLAVFAGNVSPVEGREDIKLWSFEPYEKMETKIYWCDQVFVLEPLEELVKEKEVYGLVVLDAREANIAILKGKRIVPLKHIESTVPSKTVKGGMCVASDTSISLSNKSFIPIEKLKTGGNLVSYDFKNSKLVKSVCNDVMVRNSNIAYDIVVDGTKLIATPEHVVFVNKDGYVEEKSVENLEIGDELFVVRSDHVVKEKIKYKTKLSSNQKFYDISVPNYMNFLANGIIVHNSQGRYDRLREDAINEFLNKVGEAASQALLGQENLKGVLIGGPGPVKDRFADKDYMNYQIKNKVLGIKDIGYTDEYGLEELVKRSEDLLKQAAVMKERELMQKFLVELQKGGNVAYGYTQTMKALELNAVDVLIVSENFDWVKANLRCQNGHYAEEELPKAAVENQVCDTCSKKLEVQSTEELGDVVAEKAVALGAKIEYISVDTPEGKQFKELGGVGALLRFKLD